MTDHLAAEPLRAVADLDTSTPAVVFKLDPNVMHHGGLGVIRSLGRLGVPMYGVHEQPWAPAANSRYLHGRWFGLPGCTDVDRVLEGLSRLADRIGRPAVLIPTDDAAALLLAEHGDELRPAFLFSAPPRDLPRRLAGKYSMYQLCQELDVPSPRTALPGCLAEAEDFAARTGFPLIAKLSTPWRSGGRIRSTTVLRDRAELIDLYAESTRHDAGLMLQEFVPAARGDDWFFHGYCDAGSTCRPAFTGVKHRSYPAHAGLTSLGHSVDEPILRDHITRLLARLNFRGIVDLDLRKDARTGQYQLLDFNPRLGAQFRLFQNTAGVDVVRAAYLDLTGQRVGDYAQVNDRRFLVENYDPLAALAYWRRGELNLRSWLDSWRGVHEHAWFARDDLRPFGLMCVRMVWRAISGARSGSKRDHRGENPLPQDPPITPRFRPGRAATRTAQLMATARTSTQGGNGYERPR